MWQHVYGREDEGVMNSSAPVGYNATVVPTKVMTVVHWYVWRVHNRWLLRHATLAFPTQLRPRSSGVARNERYSNIINGVYWLKEDYP